MSKYKLSITGVVREDGAFIPNSIGNADWREYLIWLEAGNTPDPQYALAELRELKVSGIKAAFEATLIQPLAVTTSTGKSFNIDVTEKAQTDFLKVLTMAQLFNTNCGIRDADNLSQTLTVPEFIEVIGQIGVNFNTNWNNRNTKIDLARNEAVTTTAAELDEITF